MLNAKQRVVIILVITLPLDLCLWYLATPLSLAKLLPYFLILIYLNVSAVLLSFLAVPPKFPPGSVSKSVHSV
jgi:hypothetical protein